jgi:hypothetical protein
MGVCVYNAVILNLVPRSHDAYPTTKAESLFEKLVNVVILTVSRVIKLVCE